MKFGTRVRIWDSLPHDKYFKNRIRGYTHFGQIYTKNTNFGDLRGCTSIFLSHKGEIWHEGVDLGLPASSHIS